MLDIYELYSRFRSLRNNIKLIICLIHVYRRLSKERMFKEEFKNHVYKQSISNITFSSLEVSFQEIKKTLIREKKIKSPNSEYELTSIQMLISKLTI